MSRLTFLTSALAVLALGVGAIGYADTGPPLDKMHRDATPVALPASVAPVPVPRKADLAIEVARGEGIAAALLRAGVGGLDAALAEQTIGDVAGPAEVWLGENVGAKARALERLSVRLAPGRRVIVEREGDGFKRRLSVEQVDLTPVRIRLDGGAGLAAGLVEAGLPRPIRDRVFDALADEKLAAIDLIVAHEASASGSRYGEPLYLGAFGRDGAIRRWVGEGDHLRLLGSAEETPAGLLRPLPGRVTSNPGLRFHPILRLLRWHRGTDFASPAGTAVQAALGGKVIEAGWRGGYGRAIRVAHADGSTTLYAHLSEIDVARGQAVARGSVIGKVGATGLATGPHLHFEWQRNGETLQPSFGAGQPASTSAPLREQATVQALLSAPFRLPKGGRS